MTEQYIDTIKQMRKKVFEDTMEQLQIMKNESDKTFQNLIDTHNLFEFLLEDEKNNPMFIDPDDSLLETYVRINYGELEHGDNGYKKQFELLDELLKFLNDTYDNLLKPYYPESPSSFEDDEDEDGDE